MPYTNINGIGPVLFERSKRAKRIIITVTPQTGVRVAFPVKTSLAKAEDFVTSKTEWISKQLDIMKQVEKEFEGQPKESDITEARKRLIGRIDKLANEQGFTYNKVSIRNQRTRWGSCSAKNDISLNSKLILLPKELMDYVILHELVHTRIKNHSSEFWNELDKFTGNAKDKASSLRKYGLALL